jgi:hypothetical protein
MAHGTVGLGLFSTSIEALRYQITHLLEGLGGKEAITLLDLLAELSEKERNSVLNVFIQVVKDILTGNTRVSSEEDREESRMVEKITGDILRALRVRGNPVGALAVCDNVKSIRSRETTQQAKKTSRLVNLEDFRTSRRPQSALE